MDIISAAVGIVPAVDEQHVLWELEGFVTGHYAVVDDGDETVMVGGEQRPRWSITSVGAADWAMQRLAEVNERAEQYRTESARWAEVAAQVAQAGVFFRQHLEQWALSQRTDRVKSFPLAHGAVTTRETPAGIIVTDEAAAVAWCKIHEPGAINVTEEVRVRDVSLRITDVVHAWRFTDGLGETWTIGPVEMEGALSGHDQYARLVVLVGGVLAEHASPLCLAADSIEAAYIHTRLRAEAEFGIVAVEPVTAPGVVDADGMVADGFGVRPSKVTPTVKVGP